MHEIRDLVFACRGALEDRRFDIELKQDGSPVTAADTFLQDKIEQALRQHIPDLSFIGEESGKDKTAINSDGVCAILDPIDGTENFCSGLAEWGVALTLWQDGKHFGSMLLLPELNRQLITGDDLAPLKSRIKGYSSSMCPEITNALDKGGEHRIMGCSVYNFYNVIRGSYASFTNPKGVKVWDLLPGLMLALEHGCSIELEGEPYDGRFLDPSRKYRVHVQH